MRQWEYKVVDFIQEIKAEAQRGRNTSMRWLQTADLEEVLNELGADGWELVDVQFILNHGEAVVVGFFKRPQHTS